MQWPTHLAPPQDHSNTLWYNLSRTRDRSKVDKFQVGIHYACSLLTDNNVQADTFCRSGQDKSLRMDSNNQLNSCQQVQVNQNDHSICQANLRNIKLIMNSRITVLSVLTIGPRPHVYVYVCKRILSYTFTPCVHT